MASRKVAPVLTALLADLRQAVRQGKADAGDAQVLRICVAELRALKGMARSGYRFLDRDGRGDMYGFPKAAARLSRAGRAKGER